MFFLLIYPSAVWSSPTAHPVRRCVWGRGMLARCLAAHRHWGLAGVRTWGWYAGDKTPHLAAENRDEK